MALAAHFHLHVFSLMSSLYYECWFGRISLCFTTWSFALSGKKDNVYMLKKRCTGWSKCFVPGTSKSLCYFFKMDSRKVNVMLTFTWRVYMLKKALSGLKEAMSAWYIKINMFCLGITFNKSESEPPFTWISKLTMIYLWFVPNIYYFSGVVSRYMQLNQKTFWSSSKHSLLRSLNNWL